MEEFLFKISESASSHELEHLIREIHMDPTHSQQIVRQASERSKHVYETYTDEPLTAAQDTLKTDWLRHK